MDAARFEALAQHHELLLVLQFGSTVTGRTHERSDVDIAVLSRSRSIPWLALGEVGADLQALFPGRTVDLAVLDHADPLFLHRVVANCRVLAGAPRALAELRMLAFRRYQDHRRYLVFERAFVHHALALTSA